MRLIGDPKVLSQRFPDSYGELANALVMRLEGNHNGGLDMRESQLRIWRDKFEQFVS